MKGPFSAHAGCCFCLFLFKKRTKYFFFLFLLSDRDDWFQNLEVKISKFLGVKKMSLNHAAWFKSLELSCFQKCAHASHFEPEELEEEKPKLLFINQKVVVNVFNRRKKKTFCFFDKRYESTWMCRTCVYYQTSVNWPKPNGRSSFYTSRWPERKKKT